jgi:hypothetical protein
MNIFLKHYGLYRMMEKIRFYKNYIYIVSFIIIFNISLITILLGTSSLNIITISIYESNLYIWIFLIVSMLISFIIAFKYNKYIKEMLIILIIIRFSILTLPLLNGYLFYEGDHIQHVTICEQLLKKGYFETQDFYPISHIIVATIQLFTNINVLTIINYFLPIFIIWSILISYYLIKFIFNKKIAIYSVLIFLINYSVGYNYNFTPMGISIYLILLFLYFLYKSITKKDISSNYCVIILCIIFPFLHPFSIFILTISLFMILIIYRIINKVYKIQLIEYIIISVILFAFYSFIIGSLESSYVIFFRKILSLEMYDPLKDISLKILSSNMSLIEIIKNIFIFQGNNLILIFFYLLLLFKFKIKNSKMLSFIYLPIIPGLIYGLYFIGLLPGSEIITSGRFLAYSSLFCIILMGVYLVDIQKISKIIYNITILILILSSLLSIINLYPSPFIYNYTGTVSKSEFNGIYYYLDKSKSENSIYTSYGLNNQLFEYINYTYLNSTKKIAIYNIPNHFNFSNLTYKSLIIIVDKRFEIAYLTIWSSVDRYNVNDFIELNNKSNNNKIFQNNFLNIYFLYNNK